MLADMEEKKEQQAESDRDWEHAALDRENVIREQMTINRENVIHEQEALRQLNNLLQVQIAAFQNN